MKLKEALKHGSFVTLQEAKPLQASADGRKRWEVVILTEGRGNPRDKHYYSQACIDDPATAKAFEGSKCFLDHPDALEERTRPERSVKDICGYFSEVKARGNALVGVLCQTLTPSGKLLEALIEDCLHFSKVHPGLQLAGLSINASGETEPMTLDGETWKKVDRIEEAFSADAVTLPARDGKFLAQLESMKKEAELQGVDALNATKKILTEMRDKIEAGAVDQKLMRRMVDSALTACQGNYPKGMEETMKKSAEMEAEAKKGYKALQAYHEALASETEDEGEKKTHQSEAEKYKKLSGEGEGSKPKEGEFPPKKNDDEEEPKDDKEPKDGEESEAADKGKQTESLRKENLQLKAKLHTQMVETKLKESGLPEQFHEAFKITAKGKTEEEIDTLLEAEVNRREVTRESGVITRKTASAGAGAKDSFKESDAIFAKHSL